MSLNEDQMERYSRHILLPEVGKAGQEQLLAGKVLIIGVGGLGSASGLYLAAAGVGKIGVIDADLVDKTNLQRQVLHSTADLGRQKVLSAKESMTAINPDVIVQTYYDRFSSENALDILKDYDFVIDGTDNFASKFLVADACHFGSTAYSHAGVLRFDGQTMTVVPGETVCYRCVFNSPPSAESVPGCVQAGVLGVLPGVIGNIQATEAVKYILGIGEMLTDRLLVYDALAMLFRTVQVSRNSNCPLCGDNPSITELNDL